MAYTEFTCDNLPDLATLEAGSMRLMPDGTYAQQVVVVTIATASSWDDNGATTDSWDDNGTGADTWDDT